MPESVPVAELVRGDIVDVETVDPYTRKPSTVSLVFHGRVSFLCDASRWVGRFDDAVTLDRHPGETVTRTAHIELGATY